MQKLTNDDFVSRAKEVHGGKYSYDFVNYTHSQTKIVIICPMHGTFEQRPVDHLRGMGCQKCGYVKKKLR